MAPEILTSEVELLGVVYADELHLRARSGGTTTLKLLSGAKLRYRRLITEEGAVIDAGAEGAEALNCGPFTVVAGPNNAAAEVIAGVTDVLNQPAVEFTVRNGLQEPLTLQSVRFQAGGSGDESKEIKAVRLTADGAVLGRQTYAADNGSMLFAGLNIPLAPAAEKTFILRYDLDKDICPGLTYQAQIMSQGVTALTATGEQKFAEGTAKGGLIRVKTGTLTAAGGHAPMQFERAGRTLPLPFTVQADEQSLHPDCAKVRYRITDVKNAQGESLGTDGRLSAAAPVTFNSATRLAEARLTFGEKVGVYEVLAELINPALSTPIQYSSADGYGYTITGGGGDVCQTVPQEGKVCFKASAEGVELVAAEYDGTAADDGTVKTFIQNIPAVNTFTAQVEPPQNFDSVTFILNGQSRREQTVPYQASGRYQAAFDMQSLLSGTSVLRVEAKHKQTDTPFEDNWDMVALPFPGWLTGLSDYVLGDSLNLQFEGDKRRYHLGFVFPTDFTWSETVDSVMPLLGGQKNEAKFSLNADAYYYIKGEGMLAADGEYATTVMGKDFAVAAQAQAVFDEAFEFVRGSGRIEATFPRFKLPDKTFAKTFPVGVPPVVVPVTAALDVGGSLGGYVIGAARLNNRLRFDEISVSPGLNLALEATASISAAVGLAKAGVTASPDTTLELTLY